MSKNKNVAIMMATYNGEKYLNEQLQSIYDQTYKDIVVYIRDDCSTDKTKDIIDGWKNKLEIIEIPSRENLGAARSFMDIVYNCGNHLYYAFCDQDDLWDKDKIEKAVLYLESQEKAALYFCNGRIISKDGAVIKESTLVDPANMNFWSEIVCGFCPGCALMVNNAFMEIIRRRTYDSLPMHDTLFALTALAIGQMYYDEEVHYSRRMHENNVVGRSGKSRLQLLKQKLKLWFIDGSKNPLDYFVKSIIDNVVDENSIVKKNEPVTKLRGNYKNRLLVVMDKRYTSTHKRAVRSFKIRVMLGLI